MSGTDLRSALDTLGSFAGDLRWETVPEDVRHRLFLVLFDSLGVIMAGLSTPEMKRLLDVWAPPPGPVPLPGTSRSASVEAAIWTMGTAAVTLELDEGNKYSRGHPGAHVIPSVLAVGCERPPSPMGLGEALLAGYEVAARFGRATHLHQGIHPHGNWGATGSAAAVGRLFGLKPAALSAAIDGAAGLAVATPFEEALAGNSIRNAWVGAANLAGVAAARMAAAGMLQVHGVSGRTLGGILGRLDPEELVAELGTRFEITGGYFKRHASCAYTHPAADALLEVLEDSGGLDAEAVGEVVVETHPLAAPLSRTEWPTRLAAMFSIPYVVSVILLTGAARPEAFGEEFRNDPRVHRLAERVRMTVTDEFEAGLPNRRGARVTVRTRDGRALAAAVSNPVGDADYRPFSLEDLRAKAADLLGDEPAKEAEAAAGALLAGAPVAETLNRLQTGG